MLNLLKCDLALRHNNQYIGSGFGGDKTKFKLLLSSEALIDNTIDVPIKFLADELKFLVKNDFESLGLKQQRILFDEAISNVNISDLKLTNSTDVLLIEEAKMIYTALLKELEETNNVNCFTKYSDKISNLPNYIKIYCARNYIGIENIIKYHLDKIKELCYFPPELIFNKNIKI